MVVLRSVALQEFLYVPVLTPTGRVHFIGWESSKCAAGRAASIFDRGREYAERLAGKHVLYLEFGVNRLFAVDPKGHELAKLAKVNIFRWPAI